MLAGFDVLNLGDQLLQRFQDNVAKALAPLIGKTGVAMLDGMFVTVTLAIGANKIAHKLGRSPQGWIVTRVNAAASIYESSSAPFSPTTLLLTSSAVATVTLWVF